MATLTLTITLTTVVIRTGKFVTMTTLVPPVITKLSQQQLMVLVLKIHYSSVIMSTMASQISNYSTVYSSPRAKKTSKLCLTGLCERNSQVTREFPAQRASNTKMFPLDYVTYDSQDVLSKSVCNSGISANYAICQCWSISLSLFMSMLVVNQLAYDSRRQV